MTSYALDLLENVDDSLIMSSEKELNYGAIRKRRYIAAGLAAAVAAAILLYVCLPVKQKISVSAFADDGKVRITESGSVFTVDTISETGEMSRGMLLISIESTVKTRLMKFSRWENGIFVGSVDYSQADFAYSEQGQITIKQEVPLSRSWGFWIISLWENWEVDPLEEVLQFEFEDGTIVTKQIVLKLIDEHTWAGTIKDIER